MHGRIDRAGTDGPLVTLSRALCERCADPLGLRHYVGRMATTGPEGRALTRPRMALYHATCYRLSAAWRRDSAK